MYHAPRGERTEAWKPSGPLSARIVAVGSSTPRPAYVLISGCLAASPGSMIGDSCTSNRWKPPPGAGSVSVIASAASERARRPTCGAASSLAPSAAWSSVNAR